MKEGSVRNFEARLMKKDGSIWWASTNAHFYKDEQGNVAGVEGITRDITEIKQIEIALRESEEKFRLAFMTSPDAITINRISDGFYIEINNGFTNLTGYAQEDVDGKTSIEMNLWHDIKDRENLVKGLEKNGEVKNLEARFRCKDGTIKLGLLSANIIQMGDEMAILAITRDITERRRTQEILIQSEKMLSIGGIAAGMAHEINNPLAGIMQNAQVIANRLSPGLSRNQEMAVEAGVSMASIVAYMEKREIFALLASLRDAGKRAADIVTNILSFSRKEESFSSEFNFKKLLEKTIKIARNDYDLKKKYDFMKIPIVKKYESDDIYVECNGSNIQQVILNILRNAAEALSEKQAHSNPRITIRLLSGKEWVKVEIEDNGPGIEETIQKKVFEPFYTTKPVGVGTGLGLSVSYFIITELHKGRITVKSDPGKGAKFIIELPFRQNTSLNPNK